MAEYGNVVRVTGDKALSEDLDDNLKTLMLFNLAASDQGLASTEDEGLHFMDDAKAAVITSGPLGVLLDKEGEPVLDDDGNTVPSRSWGWYVNTEVQHNSDGIDIMDEARAHSAKRKQDNDEHRSSVARLKADGFLP